MRTGVVVVYAIACLSLAACGGGSGSATTAPPPPPLPPPALSVGSAAAFPSLTFVKPVALLQAPGDPSRWFVVEKDGVVRVFDNDPQATGSAVFVDISNRVSARASEAGLLGLAFHPDFALNGEVFVSYTAPGSPLTSVVARLVSTDGGITLDPGSEQILLTVLQDATNHNGGQIAFGSDGYLYAGFGDGGGANDPNDRAQDPTTLLGKIVRIDVDGARPYAVVADNPFAANAPCVQGFGGAPCPEIYALGLRNPWRFSFDRVSGELWVGDVGQGAFEEVNRVVNGGNYGWRIREGAHCNIPASGCPTAGLLDPISEYGRGDGVSITGGHVYRGSEITALAGRYVFGDFGSGKIFSVTATAASGTPAELLFESGLSISAFGEGDDGELYVVDYSGGVVHRLIDTN